MYSNAVSDPFVQFGYQYLGPFLLDWYNRLLRRLPPGDDGPIFCIGREGWGLTPLFNTLEAGKDGVRRRFIYLPTSRAFLTHLSLARDELLEWGLASAFTGTMAQFAESRLGVPLGLLDARAPPDQVVVLPRDRDFLADIVHRNASLLRPVAERSCAAYSIYLTRLGLDRGRTNYLTDLGFRGTSQALLSAIFGYRFQGYYAILDPSGTPRPLTLAPNTTSGLFSDRHAFGDAYEPLDRSLLFEVFLTAPMGQLAGIQDQVRGDPFLYRDGGPPQLEFGLIAACQQGAYKFAYDNHDLIGSPTPIVEDLAAFFDEFRARIKTNFKLFEPAFTIDDSFFGTGKLNAEMAL